jgi:hypothetical protein
MREGGVKRVIEHPVREKNLGRLGRSRKKNCVDGRIG